MWEADEAVPSGVGVIVCLQSCDATLDLSISQTRVEIPVPTGAEGHTRSSTRVGPEYVLRLDEASNREPGMAPCRCRANRSTMSFENNGVVLVPTAEVGKLHARLRNLDGGGLACAHFEMNATEVVVAGPQLELGHEVFYIPLHLPLPWTENERLFCFACPPNNRAGQVVDTVIKEGGAAVKCGE